MLQWASSFNLLPSKHRLLVISERLWNLGKRCARWFHLRPENRLLTHTTECIFLLIL